MDHAPNVTVEDLISYHVEDRRRNYTRARRLMAAGWIRGTGELSDDGAAVLRKHRDLKISFLAPSTRRAIRDNTISARADLELVRLGWRKDGAWTPMGLEGTAFLKYCK